MSLKTRIEGAKTLSKGAKEVLMLLESKPMTIRQIFDSLGRQRHQDEIVNSWQVHNGLKELNMRGLITVDRFESIGGFRKMETYFTFSPDWVFKL